MCIGAIYALVHLPRDVSFRRENVLIGPHEPKHDINSKLQPRVASALEWSTVKTTCACIAMCDARKVCGFFTLPN